MKVAAKLKRLMQNRDLFLLVLITAAFGLLVMRAAYLQLFNNEWLQKEGNNRFVRDTEVKANRGVIKDRNGITLAISTPADSIVANPQILAKDGKNWEQFAKVVGHPVEKLKAEVLRYADLNRKFIYIRRHLALEHVEEVMALKMPGVYTLREYKRYYPLGASVANLLGFTNIDDVGAEGIEYAFDSTLRGTPGLKRVVKDRRNRAIESEQNIKNAVDGIDLHLSVDARIQQIVYQNLLAVVATHQASLATCVVVDTTTGEILALSTVPSFNPNVISERDDKTRNFAVTSPFEPGSTAKTFAVAKALINGVVTPDTIIDTSPGRMRIGGYNISDFRNYGELSVSDVIMKSSNIGVVKIATQIPPDELANFYISIGFDEVTGVGLQGESSGMHTLIRDKWHKNEHATLTYGYGFSITALQLVRAYAAIANGGKMVPLTIFPNQSAPEGKQVIPRSVATKLSHMLESVITPAGTSKRAKIPMYRVAGKTGTVQKLINGSYSSQDHIALFVGFAPVSNPKLAAVIVVDDPKGEKYYGGFVAAPAFRKIMTETFRLLNVPPDDLSKLVTNQDKTETKTDSQT